MTGDEDDRDITWGKSTCDICKENTWLDLVIYEPLDTPIEAEEDRPFVARHPAPQDERAIASCSDCLSTLQRELADIVGTSEDEVPFTELRKYLIYTVYPEYVEKLHPEEAERFSD